MLTGQTIFPSVVHVQERAPGGAIKLVTALQGSGWGAPGQRTRICIRAGTKNTENPPTNQPQSHPKQLPIPFYNFDFFTQGSIFSPILPILTPSCPFWAAWNQQGKQPPQTTLRAPYGAKNTPNPTPNQSQTHPKQLPTPLHNFEKSSYGGDFHPFWPFLPLRYPLREPKMGSNGQKIDLKTKISQI